MIITFNAVRSSADKQPICREDRLQQKNSNNLLVETIGLLPTTTSTKEITPKFDSKDEWPQIRIDAKNHSLMNLPCEQIVSAHNTPPGLQLLGRKSENERKGFEQDNVLSPVSNYSEAARNPIARRGIDMLMDHMSEQGREPPLNGKVSCIDGGWNEVRAVTDSVSTARPLASIWAVDPCIENEQEENDGAWPHADQSKVYSAVRNETNMPPGLFLPTKNLSTGNEKPQKRRIAFLDAVVMHNSKCVEKSPPKVEMPVKSHSRLENRRCSSSMLLDGDSYSNSMQMDSDGEITTFTGSAGSSTSEPYLGSKTKEEQRKFKTSNTLIYNPLMSLNSPLALDQDYEITCQEGGTPMSISDSPFRSKGKNGRCKFPKNRPPVFDGAIQHEEHANRRECKIPSATDFSGHNDERCKLENGILSFSECMLKNGSLNVQNEEGSDKGPSPLFHSTLAVFNNNNSSFFLHERSMKGNCKSPNIGEIGCRESQTDYAQIDPEDKPWAFPEVTFPDQTIQQAPVHHILDEHVYSNNYSPSKSYPVYEQQGRTMLNDDVNTSLALTDAGWPSSLLNNWLYQEAGSDHWSDSSSAFSAPIPVLAATEEETNELVDNGSNLLVTLDEGLLVENPAGFLQDVLTARDLIVEKVTPTKQPSAFAVQFDNHVSAKRAFTSQKIIRLRMKPPEPIKCYWFKNPAPNFHVVFETKRRLTVKKGKSTSQETVGELLMMNYKNRQGCMVWADQLKGQRLRIVGFRGRMLRNKTHIEERTDNPIRTNVPVGWISTRCNVSNTNFVVRLSGKKIEEYLYEG